MTQGIQVISDADGQLWTIVPAGHRGLIPVDHPVLTADEVELIRTACSPKLMPPASRDALRLVKEFLGGTIIDAVKFG